MRKKWVVCMIACLTILLTGCNGNTAKETARNDTDKRISSTAGNTETTTETEKADDTTSVVPETEQPVSSEATTEPSQQEKSDVSSTAGSKTETAKSYESVQVTKKPDSTQEQKQPQQQPKPKPETPTEEVKPSFDVNYYVNYAKSYAQSIGLELDSTATDCWDNPITANAKRTGIKDDIQSRLNRYKNVEGFTAVCVWAEKVSDTEYEIYIGYC